MKKNDECYLGFLSKGKKTVYIPFQKGMNLEILTQSKAAMETFAFYLRHTLYKDPNIWTIFL